MAYNDERHAMMKQGLALGRFTAKHGEAIHLARKAGNYAAAIQACGHDATLMKGLFYEHITIHAIILRAMERADTLDLMEYIETAY